MAPRPDFVCPHCYHPQSPFVQQRCAACGLSMWSDTAFHTLQTVIEPETQQLQVAWEARQPPDWQEIQPHLARLAPYREAYPFLAAWLEPLYAQLPVYVPQAAVYRKWRNLYWGVLALLVFIPLVVGVWWQDAMLVVLLAMPIFGWAFLGRALIQKPRS